MILSRVLIHLQILSTMSSLLSPADVISLLLQGQETSAILLSWACLFLAQHPHMQERIAREVDEVVGDADVSSADAGKLK
jgi:cytochrome P450